MAVYNRIEAQRAVMESHVATAAMHQNAFNHYASKRGKKNAEAAERFRKLVLAFNALAMEARDTLADMLDEQDMSND